MIEIILRGLVRLWLFAIGAALVILIMTVALGIALLSVVWSLLRGRKPAAFTVFNQFRQASQQFRTGQWRGSNVSEWGHPKSSMSKHGKCQTS